MFDRVGTMLRGPCCQLRVTERLAQSFSYPVSYPVLSHHYYSTIFVLLPDLCTAGPPKDGRGGNDVGRAAAGQQEL